jgi:hypothetical protein
MANLSVGVNVDFTGVTYTPGSGWSGSPTWTFNPPSLQVHQGNNKITWSLTTLNSSQQNSVPTGYTGGFSANNGLIFKASNPTPWTGTTPTLQTNGTITANDNFQNLSTTQTFQYTTSVTLTPNAGTTGTAGTFTKDPDVENESGGGVIKFSPMGEVAGV